ncbi:metal-dependent hydrolase [Candidatus Woesearchaeota archaeon]|nr:metal-dependent hydrolase [Candidatus Woesearchaeota archaeon]
MYPQTHFLAALFLGEVLLKLGVLSQKTVVVCAVLAVLIDLDHWAAFMIRHHEFSLKKAWNAATVKHENERTFIHHRTGFIIMAAILLITFLFNRLVFWVLGTAYLSHMFLDYVHVIEKKNFRFKELGFWINITGFELVLDFVLIFVIILLLV